MTENNLFRTDPGGETFQDRLSSPNPEHDSFGRTRVSTVENLLNTTLISGTQNTIWSEDLEGGGTSTYDFTNSCVDMAVTTTGDYAMRQTRQRLNYQAGDSQLILMTGLLKPEAGTEKTIGYCTASITAPHPIEDGINFRTIGESMYVSITKYHPTTPTTINVPQNEWNIDPLDGTGPSNITANWDAIQIFVMDFQWLGAGTVRFGVAIGGKVYYVHQQDHANIAPNVYMRTGNQCLHYSIKSTGSAGTLKQICGAVLSEGGQFATGIYATLDLGNTPISVGSTGFELVLATRLQEDSLFAVISQIKAFLISTTKDAVQWSIFWNPVISGTPNWVDIPGGSLQRWDGVGGGAHIITPTLSPDGGYFSTEERAADNLVNVYLRLGAQIDGTRDIFALGCRAFGGSASITGGVSLRQQT